MQEFFYDEQIRRFLLQFTRIFTGFQVEYGREANSENAAYLRVPVRYGDASRNAQTIIQENSANSMPSSPMMSFYITGMDYDRPRMQEPYFVSKTAVRQRTYDSFSQTYETTQGNAFSIERLMPVPYRMTINLDVWTSNTNQKLQIFEQIATLFNPSLEIQATDNYIDWTSLTIVDLERVNWTSRTIPMGTDNPIDIMTITFGIPIWISSPAMVKKLGVVERVVSGIFDDQGDLADSITNNDLLLGTRQMFTPWNYKLVVIDNKIQVLYDATVVPDGSYVNLAPTAIVADSPLLWPAVLGAYGVYRPGISQIRLNRPPDSNTTEYAIVGTFVVDPNDDRLVIFDPDPDTAPQNTLPPIDAIINPLLSGPGTGLPAAADGQQYLLVEGTGSAENEFPAEAWLGQGNRPLVAQANDIIVYQWGYWRVLFDSSNQPAGQFVTNITTGTQYEWTGDVWIKSYQGVYPAGTWSIVL
jgi:hypothetical protein